MTNSLLLTLGMRGLPKQQLSNDEIRRDLRIPGCRMSMADQTTLPTPLLLGALTLDQRELVGTAPQLLPRTTIVLSTAGKVQMSFRATSLHTQFQDPYHKNNLRPLAHSNLECAQRHRPENAPRPIPEVQNFRHHHQPRKRPRSLKRTLKRNSYCAISESASLAKLASRRNSSQFT